MMKCHYATLYGNFLQHSFVEANYTVNQKRTFNQGIDLPGFLKTEEAIALQIGSPHQIYKLKDFIIWRLFAEPYLRQFSTNHVQTDLLLIDLLNRSSSNYKAGSFQRC